ncbi:transposase [Maritalea mobilis]|uniref:integrase core domain-containing protein n=1 Tax=Maritalea mobilis TaxID=483324 RepID=UPI001C979BB6|nr:transposase [Maritalea mobilis]
MLQGSFRDDVLNEPLLSSLAETRKEIIAWKQDYNRQRPHPSPGNLSSEVFAMKSRRKAQAA